MIAWETLYGQPWDGLVVAANDIGCYWPRVLHHWVSLHPDKFRTWEPLRAQHGFPGGYVTWDGRRATGRYNRRAAQGTPQWAGGSSGCLAAQVALEQGCTKVILCGVPMTQTAHFSESAEPSAAQAKWRAAEQHWRAWLRAAERFEGRTRSLSGRTRERFGVATREWLGEPAP